MSFRAGFRHSPVRVEKSLAHQKIGSERKQSHSTRSAIIMTDRSLRTGIEMQPALLVRSIADRYGGGTFSQVLMNRPNRHRAFTHRPGDALDGAVPDIARCEHPWGARLER